MSSEIPGCVLSYIEQVESGSPRACPDQEALAAYLRRIFGAEDLIIETERLEKYLSLARYFPYELFPWEKALTALFLCTYRAPGVPRWPTLFSLVGRGAGKDGFLAFLAFCLVSPYNPVGRYDVDICAMDETQSMRPVRDIIETLEDARHEAKLKKHYYHTKELVQGRKNRGIVKGWTNNSKNRDGMRSGCIVFNEVHAYPNYANVSVFTGGLGKKPEPRTAIFSSEGNVADGPLDDYKDRAMAILYDGQEDGGFLPFLCRLPAEDMVHDEANWYMANPSLQYRPELLAEIRSEYLVWKEKPDQMGEFLTKRFGIRKGFDDIAVTDYAKIKATNRPLPDLRGWTCIAGLDYAELSDWAAVNLHFRRGEERYDINHAWLCLESKTLSRVKAPWQAWAEAGHVTAVSDVSISPDLLAGWILEAGKKYHVKLLAMDSFRWTLVAESMRKIGFDARDKSRVRLIRPSDIMRTEPVIQTCFDRGLFTWGDCPPLRWAVNNTKRVRSSKKLGVDTGNFIYAKIEAKSRKTDPWMALVAAMTQEDELGTGGALQAPKIGAIKL